MHNVNNLLLYWFNSKWLLFPLITTFYLSKYKSRSIKLIIIKNIPVVNIECFNLTFSVAIDAPLSLLRKRYSVIMRAWNRLKATYPCHYLRQCILILNDLFVKSSYHFLTSLNNTNKRVLTRLLTIIKTVRWQVS